MIKHQYRMSDLHTIKDLTRKAVPWSRFATAMNVFPNKYSLPNG